MLLNIEMEIFLEIVTSLITFFDIFVNVRITNKPHVLINLTRRIILRTDRPGKFNQLGTSTLQFWTNCSALLI